MPESPPSVDRASGADSVRIRRVSGRTILRLKSWASGLARSGPKIRVAGLDLPWEVGDTAAGELRALSTGPSDWLLVAPGPLSAPARRAIEADSARQGLALADLSSGLSALEVSGPAARDVLAKACGLDLGPKQFPGGRCARTRLAKLAVVIESHEGVDGFDVYVACSQSSWLHEWLTDSVLEFR